MVSENILACTQLLYYISSGVADHLQVSWVAILTLSAILSNDILYSYKFSRDVIFADFEKY